MNKDTETFLKCTMEWEKNRTPGISDTSLPTEMNHVFE